MMDWATYRKWRPEFLKVVDPRCYPDDYIDRLLLSGHAKLWTCDDAAVVTEFKIYPTGAADIHTLVAAGNPDSIRDVIAPQVESYGSQYNCLGSLVESRPCWAKIMKPRGYEPFQLSIRKELR